MLKSRKIPASLLALVLLSIARPVTSDAPAALAEVPTDLALD